MHTKLVHTIVQNSVHTHFMSGERRKKERCMHVPYQIRDDIDLAIIGVRVNCIYICRPQKTLDKHSR